MIDAPVMPETPSRSKGDEMLEELNGQLAHELFANHLYRSMQAYFLYYNLPGLAHWMDVQAQEEDLHAKRIFAFILERGWRVKIAALNAPPSDWESPTAVFQAAFDHEHSFTQKFNALYKLAEEANDLATRVFLQWFITEQVEEESTASEALAKVKMVESSPAGMYMLDRELGSRQADFATSKGSK